jgi:hypothetical protein
MNNLLNDFIHMKNIYLLLLSFAFSGSVFSQDFSKNLTAARSSYSSSNLTDARFAMEQMLRDLDVAIGKEVLKLLPEKMDALPANIKEDNVTGSGNAAGLFVHRTYGTAQKKANIDIVNNSPLINSLTALLSMPFVGAAKDANQKIVKVQGYKAILTRNENSDTGKTGYDLQVPMNNTLLTFTMDDAAEADVLRLANDIPLGKIAQMAQ